MKKNLLVHFKDFLFLSLLSLVVIVPAASLTCCGWILRLNKVVTLLLVQPSENKIIILIHTQVVGCVSEFPKISKNPIHISRATRRTDE